MTLTTSEELQKQHTVIFGIRGHLNLEVGEIVGIGKLSSKRTESLISEILRFQTAYSSMLVEYAGCNLHSIEFELENTDQRSHMQVMPKSMLFIPGKYKNTDTLMLLLSRELSLLDEKKAKSSINSLGEKIFEIEEALDRPELSEEERSNILTHYAHRFAVILQGEAIEEKWNRKLVGLSSGITEDVYEAVNIQKEIQGGSNLFVLTNPKHQKLPFLEDEEDCFDFSKYSLSSTAVMKIAENTYQLTSNLLKLANQGTINELQNQILLGYLNLLKQELENSGGSLSIQQFRAKVQSLLGDISKFLDQYHEICENFSKSGKSGTLIALAGELYSKIIGIENGGAESSRKRNIMKGCAKISQHYIFSHKKRFLSVEKVRAPEFSSILSYIEHSAMLVISKINQSLPRYFQHLLLNLFIADLISSIQTEFDSSNQTIVKSLKGRLVFAFLEYIQKKAEKLSIDPNQTNPDAILQIFQKTAKAAIEPFIASLKIHSDDLLEYCRLEMPNIPLFVDNINELKMFRGEIQSLRSLILRYSSLHRFLKQFPEEIAFDPRNVATEFVEFLTRKLGGIESKWKTRIFQYITDYAVEYQNQYLAAIENKTPWSKSKVLTLLLEYIDLRVDTETSIDGFPPFMKKYLNQVALKNINNRPVLDIWQKYMEGTELVDQIPDYLRQILQKTIGNLESFERKLPVSFYFEGLISLDEILSEAFVPHSSSNELASTSLFGLNFYQFILEHEMKYFSKLVARPKQILLESVDPVGFSNKPLIHRIEFQDLSEQYVKLTLKSNYKYIKPQYHK